MEWTPSARVRIYLITQYTLYILQYDSDKFTFILIFVVILYETLVIYIVVNKDLSSNSSEDIMKIILYRHILLIVREIPFKRLPEQTKKSTRFMETFAIANSFHIKPQQTSRLMWT